ncbi:uncharacterized protein ZBAI_04260 [Zygosaccharomyces bailii ISA1307]|nr:uncharacterized protein ZBAI_04260 [Zygosaccharomyces bailii ISA1307]
MQLTYFLLSLATLTQVFADSSRFKPVASVEGGHAINWKRNTAEKGYVFAADGQLFLGSKNGSITAQITDCGALKLANGTYAAVGEEGLLKEVEATKATVGFAIKGGKLLYQSSQDFYAVEKDSQYYFSISGGGGSATKVSIAAKALAGEGFIGDFSPKGECAGSGPSNVTSSSATQSKSSATAPGASETPVPGGSGSSGSGSSGSGSSGSGSSGSGSSGSGSGSSGSSSSSGSGCSGSDSGCPGSSGSGSPSNGGGSGGGGWGSSGGYHNNTYTTTATGVKTTIKPRPSGVPTNSTGNSTKNRNSNGDTSADISVASGNAAVVLEKRFSISFGAMAALAALLL